MADYSKLTKKELVMTLYARDLMLENERKQLHDLPKKIVEEIRDVLNGNDVEIQDNIYLTDFLHTILKKYGGEDESNND